MHVTVEYLCDDILLKSKLYTCTLNCGKMAKLLVETSSQGEINWLIWLLIEQPLHSITGRCICYTHQVSPLLSLHPLKGVDELREVREKGQYLLEKSHRVEVAY